MEVLGDCGTYCEVKLGNRAIVYRRYSHGSHEYETGICAITHGDTEDVACVYVDGYVERRGLVNCYGITNSSTYEELIASLMDLVRNGDSRLFDSLFNSIINAVRC